MSWLFLIVLKNDDETSYSHILQSLMAVLLLPPLRSKMFTGFVTNHVVVR